METIPAGLIAVLAAAWLLSTPFMVAIAALAVAVVVLDAALGDSSAATAAIEVAVFLVLTVVTRSSASRLRRLLTGSGLDELSAAGYLFGLENLAQLVDASVDGVAALDQDGSILYANGSAERLLGVPSEGQQWALTEYVLPAQRDRVVSYLSSGSMADAGTLSFAVRDRQGTQRYVDASHTPFVVHGRNLIALVIRDVTEVQRLQLAAAAMAETATNLAITRPLKATLDSVTRRIVEVTQAKASGVLLPDSLGLGVSAACGLPEGYAAAVRSAMNSGADVPAMKAMRTKSPVYDEDLIRTINTDPLLEPIKDSVAGVEWRQALAIPLVYSGEALGVLTAYFSADYHIEDATLDFLTAIAGQVASAVQISRLVVDLQGRAAHEERHRLSRDLHDSLSQALYGILVGAGSAKKRLVNASENAAEPIDYVIDLADSALGEMRSIVRELRSDVLEREGLVAALTELADGLAARHGLSIDKRLAAEPETSAAMKLAAYRVAQEALNNVAKHSHAKHAWLTLAVAEAAIAIEVTDDGDGFDPDASFPGHYGVESMRERAAAGRGELLIASRPGHGTKVTVVLPMEKDLGAGIEQGVA